MLQLRAKTTEVQRDKMRFCGHFVLSFVRFCRVVQVAKTKK